MTDPLDRSTLRQPKRIQRKRTRGWRMPDGAIYVGRPTVWGNPFAEFGLDLSLELYASAVRGVWNPGIAAHLPDVRFHQVYEAHQAWLKRLGRHPSELVRDLRGKDLACWCSWATACHADILLKAANS